MIPSVYLIIVPLILALIFFALGSAAVISNHTGGHPRTGYWSKIFSGIGYLLLFLQGLLNMPFLEGAQEFTTLLVSCIFGGLGAFLLSWGLRMKRRSVSR